MWDTIGGEQFQSVTSSLWRQAEAVILMYSIDDRQSFTKLTQWLDNFHSTTDDDGTSNIVSLIMS